MRVEHYATIGDLNRSEWDALAADDVFSAYGWLRAVEETILTEHRSRYFVIHGPGGLLAAAPCYLQPSGAGGPDATLFGRFAALARALRLGAGPALICGSRTGLSRHILVRPDSGPEEAREATSRLVDAMERMAGENAGTLCFRNVVDRAPNAGAPAAGASRPTFGEAQLVRVLEERGYLRAREMPTTRIEIEWSSFPEYVRALKKSHPSTAKGVTSERKRGRDAGVVYEKLADVEPSHERLHHLLDSHYVRLNAVRFPFKASFLPTLRSELGDRLVVYVAHQDGVPISVVVGFRAGDAVYLPMVGTDAERKRETSVYFNTGYNQPIEDAMQSGVRTIYGGKLVYEVKVRRGFRLVPLSMYLLVPSRLQAAALRPVLRAQRARIDAMTKGLPIA